ncbi:hypothetical protein CVU75_02480 [Candidatus Dependentiae bacterium HGW-Dependentiae-1]|nr:MAG: hypothetical protein CVU75_02480 [Candidatus Dependentiae bacterium HGW-Dependentiae-1]
MVKKYIPQTTSIVALIAVLLSAQADAMQSANQRKKNRGQSQAIVTAPTSDQTSTKNTPQIIDKLPLSYAVAAGAPEKGAETKTTEVVPVETTTNEPSKSITEETDLQVITADEVLSTEQEMRVKTEQAPLASPIVEKKEKKDLPAQYTPGELKSEIEKSGTYFRFSSRRVREKTLEVAGCDTTKQRRGTGDPLEEASLYAAGVASWKYHRTPEDIQQCMLFLNLCRENNITLDRTTCEAARDFLNEIRAEWEKETRTQLTSAEQAAQKELAKQIESIQKLYDHQQQTLGELLTHEHARLLEIRTAIAAAARLCNGAKISDKAPQIIEYIDEPALLKHLGKSRPELLPGAQVETLKNLAGHPLLLENKK